jgi:hypothetical protein
LLVLYYLVVLYVVVYVEELMHHETDEETAVADYRSRQLRHNDSRWASAYSTGRQWARRVATGAITVPERVDAGGTTGTCTARKRWCILYMSVSVIIASDFKAVL